jgi:rhomboid protease GluP
MSVDRATRSLAEWVLQSPLTWMITALNIGIFLIAWSRGDHEGDGLGIDALLAFGAIERTHVWRGEPWRLLTAVFLHVTWIHLIWNTLGMFSLCADVEKTVGSGWFAFAYLTTGVGASAVSLLVHHVLGAGASGAAFGMIGVTLAILYRRAGSWEGFTANPYVRRIFGWTLIWVVIGFTMLSGIDNYAHLGGFAFGLPCGMLLEYRRGRNRNAWMAGVAAYILVWAGIVAAACIPGLALGGRGG